MWLCPSTEWGQLQLPSLLTSGTTSECASTERINILLWVECFLLFSTPLLVVWCTVYIAKFLRVQISWNGLRRNFRGCNIHGSMPRNHTHTSACEFFPVLIFALTALENFPLYIQHFDHKYIVYIHVATCMTILLCVSIVIDNRLPCTVEPRLSGHLCSWAMPDNRIIE